MREAKISKGLLDWVAKVAPFQSSLPDRRKTCKVCGAKYTGINCPVCETMVGKKR